MTRPYIYPPLGLLTCVSGPVIAFRVHFIHSSSSEAPPVSDVEIWSDMSGDGEWHGTPLVRTADSGAMELTFLDVAQLGEGCQIEQFYLDLPASVAVARRFEFTLRWKSTDSPEEWKWASAAGHNARIALRPRLADSGMTPASYWRQQLRSLLRPACSSDTLPPPATAIADSWQVSSSGASCMFKPSEFDNAASGADFFGQLEAIDGILAFARKDPFWIIPRAGTDTASAAGLDVVLVLIELSTGAYAALMPFAKDAPTKHTVVFRTGPSNTLYLRASPALDSATSSIRVAASVSQRAHDAIHNLLERIQLALPRSSIDELCAHSQPAPPHATSLSGSIGYCTWNTFYQQVSHDGVVSVLSDLCRVGRATRQPVPEWVVIDDGWQTTTQDNSQGQLSEICANRDKFPGRLKQTVQALSKLGIARVGAWHALWGYWGGIDPSGDLARRYTLERYHRKWCPAVKAESDVWLISSESVAAFYDEFYQWLHAQGISFVKVDYQAAFETLSELDGSEVYSMYNAYYDAMESAARRYFGPGSVIYCMAQTPHLILRTLQHLSPAPSAQQREIMRNSDDYYPDVPESHGWHIYCNMANALWSRQLDSRLAGDWDMFQPGKKESHLHAAARILSAGPLYITGSATDYSQQDLASVIGHTGRTPLPSPPLIASSCLFADMTTTAGFLIGSTTLADESAVIISVHNVFHELVVAPVLVSQILAESAATGSLGDSHYVIHQQSTNKVCICQIPGDMYTLALRLLACEALTVAKMAMFQSTDRSATLYATCIGDTSRYAGIAVVERNVFGVVQKLAPSSHLSRARSPCGSGQRQWTLRARIASGSNSFCPPSMARHAFK
ncbi:hypothetical protein IWW39_005238 [Coemansia spiralis]|uniref:Alpha-galactosidase n=1 Tax=Coemansia spiralis TaxID=417178 RepID=A0A9W8GHZ8_9FUNG|nr:hypothetical protein IWW39_005238 [Coemansia spiralis]